MFAKTNALATLRHGPDGPGDKSAAAVRADIKKNLLHAIGAEGALVAADAGIRCTGGQVLIAIFAVRPEL